LLAAAVVSVAVAVPMRAAAAPPPASVAVPTLQWAACGGPFQCATARVPLDYNRPDGTDISLALIRLPAGDPAHRIGSLFVNPGGPGGSGVDFVRQAARFLWSPAVRARFDIVGFDPRGVGRSSPIRCFPSNRAEGRFLDGTPPFPVGRQQVVQFISTFEQFAAICLRANATIMQHMATADVARDLDLLRHAVGDRRLTYDGVSYGSYLGDTYANLFPDHVRALIIDGVLNPVQWATGTEDTSDLPFSTRLNSAAGTFATLQQFFKLCEAGGQTCAFSSGDPEDKYETILARARRHPVDQFTYADVVDITLGNMYNPFGWANFAQFLQSLYVDSGSTTTAAAALPQPVAPGRARWAYQNGLDAFFAVACSDTENPHNPFVWPKAAREQDEDSPYFGADWTYASEPCSTWPATDSSRYLGPFNRETSNPVLVIGNYFDPATPYAGAQAVSHMLPNSRLLSLDGWGHTSLAKSACINSYITDYLIDTSLPPAGTVCQPDFVPFQSVPSVADTTASSALSGVTGI
jgi:pimeloyl-ACP methyl ester carboxylesterase